MAENQKEKYLEEIEDQIRTIGVLTSGGDAPGMNAAIRAVVRTALSRGLGLAVLPKYRGIGVASELMRRYSGIQRQQGRCALILTCLDAKVEMYKKMGFEDEGISDSSWGGEQWHQMRKGL